nr:MAG TPA: hypothetical protein [Caudoviricetes sp.]
MVGYIPTLTVRSIESSLETWVRYPPSPLYYLKMGMNGFDRDSEDRIGQ